MQRQSTPSGAHGECPGQLQLDLFGNISLRLPFAPPDEPELGPWPCETEPIPWHWVHEWAQRPDRPA